MARLGGRSRGIVVFPPKTVKASRLHQMSIPYGERIEIFNGPMSEGVSSIEDIQIPVSVIES